MQRTFRQTSVILVFLGTLALVGTAVFFIFFRKPPTCTDGIQNQDEAGIDCGGSCQEMCVDQYVTAQLVINESGALTDSEGETDLYATVTNPNGTAALRRATYTFLAVDAKGTKRSLATGTFSLLPKETKSILAIAVDKGLQVTESMQFEMTDESWSPLESYSGKPAVNVYQKRYQEISSGAGFSEAYGLVSNESQYDFQQVGVNVILRDSNRKPVALNKTVLNAIRSGEQRDFRLLWPHRFSGEVSEVEAQIDIDMFSNDVFMRQYFPSGQFQDLGPTKQ